MSAHRLIRQTRQWVNIFNVMPSSSMSPAYPVEDPGARIPLWQGRRHDERTGTRAIERGDGGRYSGLPRTSGNAANGALRLDGSALCAVHRRRTGASSLAGTGARADVSPLTQTSFRMSGRENLPDAPKRFATEFEAFGGIKSGKFARSKSRNYRRWQVLVAISHLAGTSRTSLFAGMRLPPPDVTLPRQDLADSCGADRIEP